MRCRYSCHILNHLEINGNARSITAIARAHTITSKNSFLCGLKYDRNICISLLFLLDMVCALAIAVIDLTFPFISRWCMYKLLPDNAWRTFWTVMVVVFCAYILRSVFTYIITYWGHTFGVRVETDFRHDLFQHIQELSYAYFDNARVGQLMSQLTSELFDITEFAHHAPEDIFISTVTIIGALIIMFTIQWKLALVIAVTIPIFLLVVWKCRFSMQNASRNVKKEMASINTDFESGLSGLRTAKAFANEEKELNKFDSANLSYRDSKADFYRAMALFNSVMEFFMCILSVIVIAVGGALIMSEQLNIIDLITFSLYVSTFVNPDHPSKPVLYASAAQICEDWPFRLQSVPPLLKASLPDSQM